MKQPAGGLGLEMLGAEDMRRPPSNFGAAMFTIFCASFGCFCLVVSLNTTHWFVSSTGSHVGLMVYTEKDWNCGSSCPNKSSPVSGPWKTAGSAMMLGGYLGVGLMAICVLFQCANLTEHGSRKKALVACSAIDIATLVLTVCLCVYFFVTDEERTRTETQPDANGVSEKWTVGSSMLAAV